jgi:hypothetical protein
MPANYSLNFDFGTCSVGPLGRGKKPSRLQQMLGDDPFENSLVEQMSLINKAIFQAPAPSYSKRCVSPRIFPAFDATRSPGSGHTTGNPRTRRPKKRAFFCSFSSKSRASGSERRTARHRHPNVPLLAHV